MARWHKSQYGEIGRENDHCEREICFSDDLSLDNAICSFSDAIENKKITGCFGDYLYSVNGNQIILDNLDLYYRFQEYDLVISITGYQRVLMSKAGSSGKYRRQVQTWEDLRQALEEGYVIGTDKKRGIKTFRLKSGTNYSYSPEDIFVFDK